MTVKITNQIFDCTTLLKFDKFLKNVVIISTRCFFTYKGNSKGSERGIVTVLKVIISLFDFSITLYAYILDKFRWIESWRNFYGSGILQTRNQISGKI